MGFLISAAVLGLVVSGLLFILGIERLAKRLALFSVVLAITAPLIETTGFHAVNEVINHAAALGSILTILICILGVVLLLMGVARYRQHRSLLERSHEASPTSLKRRVQRD